MLAARIIGSTLIVLSDIPLKWHEIPIIGLSCDLGNAVSNELKDLFPFNPRPHYEDIQSEVYQGHPVWLANA